MCQVPLFKAISKMGEQGQIRDGRFPILPENLNVPPILLRQSGVSHSANPSPIALHTVPFWLVREAQETWQTPTHKRVEINFISSTLSKPTAATLQVLPSGQRKTLPSIISLAYVMLNVLRRIGGVLQRNSLV